jgi:membrane protein
MYSIKLKDISQIFKQAFKDFGDHKVTKLSGSLAYSTVFSMGPLLIVLLSICSIVWGKEAAEGREYEQLKAWAGTDTAAQLQLIIKNTSIYGKSNLALIVGIITLLFGSTAIFSEIQDSINSIWGLKPKPKNG